jgi:hypothetical protein
MTATYTFDVFSTLDGFANHSGDWGGYWGKRRTTARTTSMTLAMNSGRHW